MTKIIGCSDCIKDLHRERKREKNRQRRVVDRRTHAHTRVTVRDFFYARHGVLGDIRWIPGLGYCSSFDDDERATKRSRYGRFHENTRMEPDNQRALRASYEPIFSVCRGNSMIKTYSTQR